jgi:hypothetical protein
MPIFHQFPGLPQALGNLWDYCQVLRSRDESRTSSDQLASTKGVPKEHQQVLFMPFFVKVKRNMQRLMDAWIDGWISSGSINVVHSFI